MSMIVFDGVQFESVADLVEYRRLMGGVVAAPVAAPVQPVKPVVRYNPSSRRLPGWVDEAMRLRLGGMSLRGVAKSVGVSHNRVYVVLSKMGGMDSGVGSRLMRVTEANKRNVGNGKRWSVEEDARIKDLVKQGFNRRVIADKFGVDAKSLSNRMHRLGVRSSRGMFCVWRRSLRGLFCGRW